MSESILEKYSVLNNYHYNDKPTFMTLLDFFSTPCRRVLGGRNIYVLDLTGEEEMTTAGKVATVVFSILIFPIAAFSIVCFALKLASLPWIWEKKKITQENKQNRGIIDLFNRAFQSNQLDIALEVAQRNPQVVTNQEISRKLFKVINQKINNGASWEELQTMMPLLSSRDACVLINHAIKLKLSRDFPVNLLTDHTSEMRVLEFDQIWQLVHSSLRGVRADIQACLKMLISRDKEGALVVDETENPLLNVMKLDLADRLISTLKVMKKCDAKDDLERQLADMDLSERIEIFKKDQNSLSYSLLFNSPDSMKQIHEILDQIGNMNKIREKLPKSLQDPAVQTNLNQIRSALGKIQQHIQTSSAEHTETTCIVQLFDSGIQLLEAIKKGMTPQQIQEGYDAVIAGFDKETQSVLQLVETLIPSGFASSIESLLKVLRLKNLQMTLNLSTRLNSFLMNEIARACGEKVEVQV